MSPDRSQQGLITWMVGCCQAEGVRHTGSNLFPFKAHMFRKERAAPVRGTASEISPWHQTRQGQGWSCSLAGARLLPALAASSRNVKTPPQALPVMMC